MTDKGELTDWPRVAFRFTVGAGGRKLASSDLGYADSLDVAVSVDDEGLKPLAAQKYWILNSWGRREATLGDDGRIQQKGLPPGGAAVLVNVPRLLKETS